MSLNVRYEQKTDSLQIESSRFHPARQLDYRVPHLHREVELVLYYGGKTEAYADSVAYSLLPGDIFITFPNQIHKYETHATEEFYLMIVKPELIPELLDVFQMSAPSSSVIRGMANEPLVRMLAERIELLWRDRRGKGPYFRQQIHGYLLALFSEIISRMAVNSIPVADSDTLRTIVSYCSRNFSSNLSLSVLEENLHLNKYYISHLFSGRLGLRFNDYVNSLRVSEACRYLLNSTHSITEISDLVGFNTPRTFNRAFLRQIGTTPSEYRRTSLSPAAEE